mgnify:FL=1
MQGFMMTPFRSYKHKAGSVQKTWIGFVAFSLLVVVGIWTWLSETVDVPTTAVQTETPKPPATPSAGKVEMAPAEAQVEPIAESVIWKVPALTAEEGQRRQQWLNRYAAARTDAEKADLLSEAMASEELSVRMALVLQALQTGSQEVRIEALRSLVGVSGQAQLAAYKMAFADDDPIVRDAALQIARDQEPEVRMPTYELALASPHPEVRQQTFVELTREPGKAAFEIYMRTLDATDSSLRGQFWQHFAP